MEVWRAEPAQEEQLVGRAARGGERAGPRTESTDGTLKGGRGRCWKGAGEEEGTSAGGVRGRGFQEGESTASALQRDEGASLEQGSRLSVEKEGRVAIRTDLSWGAVTWGQNVRHEIGSEVGKSRLRGMKIGKRGWSGKAAVSTEKADALCATEGPAESRGHALPGEAGTRLVV